MSKFFVGLDLGQAQDYSAVSILEKILPEEEDGMREYHLRHLYRYPLGTSYADVCRSIRRMVEEPELRRQSVVVIDLTGTGRPIQDLFREMHLLTIGINISHRDTI